MRKLAEVVTLLTCIQEVPSSAVSCDTDNLPQVLHGLPQFFQVSSGMELCTGSQLFPSYTFHFSTDYPSTLHSIACINLRIVSNLQISFE